MWEPKRHKMVARHGFDRGDGVRIAKGQVFEVVVTSFTKNEIEFYALHFDNDKPLIIPCAYATFSSCKEPREAE